MELHELCDAVHDKASFLVFAETLQSDRRRAVALESERPSNPYGPDAGGWENTSIEGFLGAGISWMMHNPHAAEPRDVAAAWRGFATFLYCGKIRE